MQSLNVSVNPIILKWARERLGLSIDSVAKFLKKDPSIIIQWENGESKPTYVQLEKLSYQLYKRPLAVFFFPTPPDEPEITKSFRTLPDIEIQNFIPDTYLALRQAQSMQLALKELSNDINKSEKKIFSDIIVENLEDVISICSEIRSYLNISIEEQIKWMNVDTALKNWRKLLEDSGIYIFKRSFKQKEISGFCLIDIEFPIIYLNNSTSQNRQIFTIFHELAHILLKVNGMTKADDSYINILAGMNRNIEYFCNQFAGELLVPSQHFNLNIKQFHEFNDAAIYKLADIYKVSREVILRKLIDRKLVDGSIYESKANIWAKEFENNRKGKKGGDYYSTQITYLGDKFLKLVFSKYYEGSFSIDQVADYCNLKVNNIDNLEHYFMNKMANI